MLLLGVVCLFRSLLMLFVCLCLNAVFVLCLILGCYGCLLGGLQWVCRVFCFARRWWADGLSLRGWWAFLVWGVKLHLYFG